MKVKIFLKKIMNLMATKSIVMLNKCYPTRRVIGVPGADRKSRTLEAIRWQGRALSRPPWSS